jgi:outer membrane receptor for ferrienterochelin and colicins
MKQKIFALFLILCGLCLNLKAETQGDVVGRVLDDSGAPLAGATVQILHAKGGVTTDEDGYFRIPYSKDGAVRVKVSYVGYQTQTFVLKADERKGEQHVLRLQPDATALDQVVVTATRTPKALKDAPVVTRLITANDIKIADATNIQDLLTEQMPGLEFGYAMNQETSLNMNGFGGNAVLFLVDGERLAGETMDNVDYSRLNLDNVGRIEIVKGAASALYGANAVAGVINIISRENSEPWTANVNTRYNDFNKEWRHGGSFSFNAGKWNSQTSIQRTTSDEVQLTSPFDTESNILHIYGGETFNVKERLTYKLSDKVKLIGRGGYFNRISKRSNYDDHYMDYSAGLKTVMNLSENDNLEISYGFDQYDKARYVNDERTHDHDYTNRQNTVRALYSHIFGKNTLTVGADFLNDYLTTYQFADNESKNQNSCDAFAQFDYNPLQWLNIVASLRHDYFSASSQHATTGRLALMTKWKGFSIRANYAGGFRAPTLKEMYMNFDMAGMQMIYGNPDLKPEKSNNYNLALEHTGRVKNAGFFTGQYSLTLMGYYNKYDKRITTGDYKDYQPGAGQPDVASRYCNEDGVEVSGIDFSAQYRSDMGLGVKLDYSYLHVGGRSVDSQFSQPRPHSATWRLDYDRQLCSFYRINAALSGRYLSSPDTNIEKHDSSYQLWKFTLQQRFLDAVNLNFTVDNLFGYTPKNYYWSSAMTTGRTFSVGLSIDIDRFVKVF